MSIRTIRDAIIVELNTISNIGLVEGRQGRKESLPWTDTHNKGVLPLWTVTCSRSGLKSMQQPMGHNKCYERVYRVRGFYPHSFEADSDTTWTDYLDAVATELAPTPAIAICAMTTPPTLMENDFVMYGDVLCHFAMFEFHTEEWIS